MPLYIANKNPSEQSKRQSIYKIYCKLLFVEMVFSNVKRQILVAPTFVLFFWCSGINSTLNITGLERTVQKLIDSGAAVNNVNNYNVSALMFATESGKHDINALKISL